MDSMQNQETDTSRAALATSDKNSRIVIQLPNKENTNFNGENDVNNTIIGNDQYDNIDGGNLADWLDGGRGDDWIWGYGGDDTIIGGKGNDHYRGDAGSDTYIFNRGDGHDVLWNSGNEKGDRDVLLLNGINASDIQIEEGVYSTRGGGERDGVKLIISNPDGTKDSIILHDIFNKDNQTLDIKFADGRVWNMDDVFANINKPNPDPHSDFKVTILPNKDNHNFNGDDGVHNKIIGNDQYDNIDGGNLADWLDGGRGDDWIWGYGGDDTIIGGKGDDHYRGDAGSDTYIFNRGDGHDVLWNSGNEKGDRDTLLLNGITAGDIQIEKGVYSTRGDGERNGIKLIISNPDGTKDSIVLHDIFNKNNQAIDIKFADGTVWNIDDVFAILSQSDPHYNFETTLLPNRENSFSGWNNANNKIIGNDQYDNINGGNLADWIDAGKGDDWIWSNGGDDTIIGGEGNDQYRGGAGSDTYIFNRGDGHDVLWNDGNAKGDRDTLQLNGISANDIQVEKGMYSAKSGGTSEGIKLIISNPDGTKDSIVLHDIFNKNNQALDIKFGDGNVWKVEDLAAQLSRSNRLMSTDSAGSSSIATLENQASNFINNIAAFDPPSAHSTTFTQSDETYQGMTLAVSS